MLPFTSYRAPAWNHGHKVLDPLPRYLRPDYVVNDQLAVDDRIIAGEDPRVPDVLAALARPDAGDRAVALADLGVGAVVRDRSVPTTPTYDAAVAGTVVFDGADLEVTVLDVPVDDRTPPTGWLVALALAWAAFAGVALTGGWNAVQGIWPVMRTGREAE
ncbi:hypothetical protein GCM10009606_25290 [Nocardioides aquiterrae]|uniref:Uncharacterized protein n=1 Tax=Nocardioides aquiterrae TaxID=203799 RepID=A0ABP4EZY2_9ACTN